MFYNIFPTRIDRAEVVGKKADGQTNQEEINSATTVAYQSIVGSNNVQQSLQQTLLLKEETNFLCYGLLLNVLVIEQEQQARNQRERYDPYHIFQIDYE
uniref:Uncharacterized protein n=1 Tax=Glossina palpalis gambiensis TaxID=67801 RepID=A0A1B0C0D2_9MUSC